MFKEGQKVWCSAFGWGTVISIESYMKHPIYVEFDTDPGPWTFSEEGALLDGAPRSLFFDEVIPDRKALTPPIVYQELLRGDVVVLVNNSVKVAIENSSSEKNHFVASDKLARTLEDAYSGEIFNKEDIKKVLGNIND